MGINTLQAVIKADLPGYYTKYSLRATCVTRMCCNDVEQQIIQEFTGHHSLAVRSYKCTSAKQKKQAFQSLYEDK